MRRSLAAFVLFSGSLLAQATTQSPGATLSGHVTLADSGRPARFATLYLKPLTPPNPQDDFFSVLMDSAIGNMQSRQPGEPNAAEALQSARTAAANFSTAVSDSLLCATVDAEGAYTVAGVPPGRYLLHVKAPGYVDALAEFSAHDLTSPDPAIRKRLLATVPSVTVAGDEHVREDLRLDRGAAVTGRLGYDDGSPAPGWTVTAILRRNASPSPAPTIFGIDLSDVPLGQKLDRTLSDDSGHFRIAGLPAGDYILQATLSAPALDRQPFAPVASAAGSFLSMLGGLSSLSALRLSVFSGGTIHLHDAESFTLHPGEERVTADLIVPLSATRSVSGILLATDGHPLNAGTVQLVAQDADGHDDPQLHFSADVHPDGSFRFDYVPAPSAYKLLSLRAADTSPASTIKLLGTLVAERKTRRAYAPASLSVSLRDADLTGIRLIAADLPSTP